MYSILLIFVAALLFPGIITRVKSICSGRKGPSLVQPLHDVARLLRKGSVISETTGFVFRIAPAIYLASIIMAIATVPFGDSGALLSFKGDFVFFAYVLAFGKFFSIVGALDTGSSFEGMGASRESLYSMLADGVVVTGPISAHMAEALDICLESVPEPRISVLAGTDAISGGIFALEENTALDRHYVEKVHTDLYLPGNPCHPLTVINGLLDLTRNK